MNKAEKSKKSLVGSKDQIARIIQNRASIRGFWAVILIVGPMEGVIAAPPPPPANCNAAFSISAVTPLDFGGILSAGAGTVTVDETGARTYVGVTPILSTTTSAAEITGSTGVLDCTGVKVAVTLPASITLNGPGSPMTLNAFTTSLPKSNKWAYLTTNLFIGGTLTVGASQTPGHYQGYFSVDILFQ
jgi:hypothetical protein